MHRTVVLRSFPDRRIVRAAVALVAALLIALAGALPARAGTTGIVTGIITDANGAPVAGAAVTMAAPTGRYAAKTDARGFFSVTGVSPDTYVVSIEKAGFQTFTIQGVTVVPDQTATVNGRLLRTLQKIGGTTARSAGSAFQPNQTQDTYTVTSTQIDQALGKSNATSETDLLIALPGATLDSFGYPVLRGGRENEEGFQFEGIDYTDPFTHQFINSLHLNGTQSLQLTPGAGDASIGNAGTGAINLVAKRGAYPAFGTFEYEDGFPGSQRQVTAEVGWATPNGAISNFASFIGNRYDYVYGPGGSRALDIGAFFNTGYESDNDFVDNFVVKFGRNQNQSLQLFYQNQISTFLQNYGGFSGLQFPTNDPFYLSNAEAISGLTAPEIQEIVTLGKQQLGPAYALTRPPAAYYQPNETYKLQYSISPDPSTFLTTKFYVANSVVDFDFPFDYGTPLNGPSFTVSGFDELQGGKQTGITLDGTKQLGEKHLLQFGGKYAFLQPVYSFRDTTDSLFFLSGFGGGEAYDFLPANSPSCAPLGVTCGYLQPYFPNGLPRLPAIVQTAVTQRQDSALYVRDQYSPNSRLKIDAGLRLDIANYLGPACSIQTCLPTSTGFTASGAPDPAQDKFDYDTGATRRPHVWQPRLAASWQAGTHDSLRASYARSVQFATLGTFDLSGDRREYAQYTGIPANQAICGTTGDRPCANYADELYWQLQNGFLGVPIQPVRPATFSNWDFTYSHDFGHGVALKLTPFYRLSTDDIANVATPKIVNGAVVTDPTGGVVYNPSVATNLGTSKTTGVELYVTKDAAVGLSGQLSVTYINELSNVIPLSASEDFYPSIPTQSLLLNNIYRVGFISPLNATLALTYRTKNGWKFNPIFRANDGYPINNGSVTAVFVNGIPYNVPNTNVTEPYGSTQAPCYVDPQNPGTVFNPVYVACRGNKETASAGGILSAPRVSSDADIEYSGKKLHGTFGLLVTNIFGNIWSEPAYNDRYQPVVTGLSGPLSGYTNLVTAFPGEGFGQYTAIHGTSPYILYPYNSPRTYNVYYSYKF